MSSSSVTSLFYFLSSTLGVKLSSSSSICKVSKGLGAYVLPKDGGSENDTSAGSSASELSELSSRSKLKTGYFSLVFIGFAII